jgi:hypothetical protein
MLMAKRMNRQLTLPKPTRVPWGATRPIAIIALQRPTLGHGDYPAAKAGDIDAASRLVWDLMEGSAGKLQRQIRKTDPIVVPVHAIEGLSYNVIPVAMAEYIGLRLGLRTNMDLQQVNRVGHTGSGGYHRLATPALFAGDVMAGEKYLLVDDFVGQGGTLANLRARLHLNQRWRRSRNGFFNRSAAVCYTGRHRRHIKCAEEHT